MKNRYTYLLIISLLAMNLIACNKNNETLENKVETEQSDSEIVESVEETESVESEFIEPTELEVTETIEVETETESVETSGLIKQEEGGSSLTDEEWAEYDAELEELLNESTETEGSDGGPWFEGNPITKEEWNNHNW